MGRSFSAQHRHVVCIIVLPLAGLSTGIINKFIHSNSTPEPLTHIIHTLHDYSGSSINLKDTIKNRINDHCSN